MWGTIVVEMNVGILEVIGDFYDDHEAILVSSSCLYGLDDFEMF